MLNVDAGRRLSFACALLLSTLPGVSVEAANADAQPAVVFDHLESNRDAMYSLRLRDGDKFLVEIRNTLPDQFDYDIAGIVAGAAPSAPAALVPPTPGFEPKILEAKFDSRYKGYLVSIKLKPGKTGLPKDAPPGSTTLKSVTLIIEVRTEEFHAEVSGGFTGSTLTDPVFALETRTDGDVERQYVVQDEGAEDAASLGLASFVHVYHDAFPHAALTFGLGITSTSRTSYYLGATARLGTAATLTAGGVWGSVSRLPAGLVVGQPAPAGTTFTDLPTRVKGGFFVAISYTFIKGAGDAIQKPFAVGTK